MNYDNPYLSGFNAWKAGKKRSENPASTRTHANAHLLWDQGWEQARSTEGQRHTVDSVEEFNAAAEAMMQWLAENEHPHMTVIITNNSCELVEGVRTHNTDEFITA